ncbi:MAG: hypothetical protein GX318_07295 [Clostridia bacterium]|nr:hypothetical protein [Clostridia bacterium]
MKKEVKILRYNPQIDGKPYYQEFEYEHMEGMTVLDILNQIYENVDSTLSYSHSCGNGHCGLCGVVVNGKAVLACKTPAVPGSTIEPLRNISVVKDLVIDREEYERKLPKLRLFLERQCAAAEEPEKIDMEAFDKFKVASRCVECLCCVSVCPVFKKSPHLFEGPMAYILEARHYYDPRDDLNRTLIYDTQGVERCICETCDLCSRVCMHKVDPAGIMGDIKGTILKEREGDE